MTLDDIYLLLMDISEVMASIHTYITYLVVIGAAAIIVYIIIRPILNEFW